MTKRSIKIFNSVLDLGCRGYSRLFSHRVTAGPGPLPSGRVRRILVIQLFALGDVLLSLPLLKGLRSVYPDGKIDFWIGKNWRELRLALPYVNRVINADSGDILKSLSVMAGLRRRRYDLAFVLYPVLAGSWLAWLSGARYRVGYTRDFDDRESLAEAGFFLLTHPMELGEQVIHDTQRYLDLGRFLGLPLKMEPPFLYPPRSAGYFVHHFFQEQGFDESVPLIGINPNASWLGKRWPSSKFARLADQLIEGRKVQVVFFGSRSEKGYVQEVISFMKNKPLSAAGCTSLVQMAGLIRHCRLFISNDSGPMHMACALDVPTLAVMGPTKVGMFRPWASRSRLIRHLLPCTPCPQENTERCRHLFACIRSVSVDSVYEAAVEMMRSCP